ncbi:MAG: hypothetical protein EZS26_001079 [Candidatus Ordinivivax streblomastigis]|uniref:Uncharacterized protein n=1 Tax=Candidatus Ordinivivax streblomastigis TaxID=2540710 RepID=A0A5M8P2J9_9BACT|nr:MAG: hypothetical protein EZS26_001079 [Candidatus Ordinivivax streblomastigis]
MYEISGHKMTANNGDIIFVRFENDKSGAFYVANQILEYF